MDGDINWIYSVVSLCHTCFVDRCSTARGRSFIVTNPKPRPQFMHVGRAHHPSWIHCQHARGQCRRRQGHHGRTQRGAVPLLMDLVPSSAHGSAVRNASAGDEGSATAVATYVGGRGAVAGEERAPPLPGVMPAFGGWKGAEMLVGKKAVSSPVVGGATPRW